MRPLSFFIKNIGKRIYRDDSGCTCQDCQNVVKDGLVIKDEQQAEYIFTLQNDYKAEGIDLNYRSKK